MHHVILIPGIMGSELRKPNGTLVWPPTALETQFGYKRIDDLLEETLVVGDIVRAVWCMGVYRPLISQLTDIGFAETGPQKRLHVFAYDWRRDLEGLADLLAQRIGQVSQAGATSVTLVAHSMGGLIARLVLESGKHDAAPWFGQIKTLITLGTPHLGAPLALARIMGLDTALGISGADFKRMAADRRYPSGYQLLPPETEGPCWDVAGTGTLGALNIYDPAVAVRLGLDKQLLKRARWVHGKLARGRAPAGVRYFQFAGSGHSTATRVNIGTAERRVTHSPDAGDGTVPLWSAMPCAGQKQVVPGNHTEFFGHPNFSAVFYRLLGKTFPRPPLGAAPVMGLSVQDVVIPVGREIELLLSPSAPTGRVAGSVTIERTDDPDHPWAAHRPPIPVSYEGPDVSQLVVRLPAPGQPGLYRVTFAGEPAGANEAMFAATEA